MKKFLGSIFLLLSLIVFSSLSGAAEKGRLNVIFIGNSITQGVLLSNPAVEGPAPRTMERVEKEWGGPVSWANCGVSGATTLDFLPATGTLFNNVVAAADTLYAKGGTTLFTISLGTNDSACTGPMGSPVLPQQYETNLKVIIDTLFERYPGSVAVVQYPLWYSPTTYNGSMYLLAGLKRLQSYFPRIEKLVEDYGKSRPGHVFAGDPSGFDLFRDHYSEWFVPENGNAGVFYLHPNPAGAEKLGGIWASPILKAAEAANAEVAPRMVKKGKKRR